MSVDIDVRDSVDSINSLQLFDGNSSIIEDTKSADAIASGMVKSSNPTKSAFVLAVDHHAQTL